MKDSQAPNNTIKSSESKTHHIQALAEATGVNHPAYFLNQAISNSHLANRHGVQ